MAKSFVKALTLSPFNSAGLNGNLQAINGTGIAHSCSIFKVINASNVPIIISYDGVNDNDLVPVGGVLSLELQTNSSPSGWVAMMRQGTIVYAKSTTGAGGVGTIYVGGYYQEA